MPELSAAPLDTHYSLETPEGIDLLLRPAGLVPRALAFSVDLVIRAVSLVLLYTVLTLLGEFGFGLFAIATFIIMWWYMVLFEVLNQGRTPGKILLKLKVIHDDGTPISWPASLTRNLLRVVDIMPFAYTFGIISCLNHPAFKRLGDIAAGSLVVYQTPMLPTITLPEADPLPCPWPINTDEQRAILGFAERGTQLTAERRLELAALLAAPLSCPAEVAEHQLHGVARALRGDAR